MTTKARATTTKAKPAADKPRRTPKHPGDEVGAAELGRRVAANMRARRHQRGMSLDELAEASGVSRAALSQIETSKSNPSLGVLWKIAVGFGIPFAELIGDTRDGVGLLRRAETQVLRSADGKFESRPLMPAGAGRLVELYELSLAARASHVSEPHAAGTREVLTVIAGVCQMQVGDAVHELAAGDTIHFPADQPHTYANPSSSPARYHNLIIYPR